MEVYTIGFTKKNAREFFGRLKQADIRRLVDIRLHNASQLAGFTKKEDLRFFLEAVCGAEYVHERLLAPTQALLDDYKKRKGSWEEYEAGFLRLMEERRIEHALSRDWLDRPTVLLCSEPEPDCCHRRLVAEYLRARWGNLAIIHL
jgi:uncharacterized protein (DUF488 family)